MEEYSAILFRRFIFLCDTFCLLRSSTFEDPNSTVSASSSRSPLRSFSQFSPCHRLKSRLQFPIMWMLAARNLRENDFIFTFGRFLAQMLSSFHFTAAICGSSVSLLHNQTNYVNNHPLLWPSWCLLAYIVWKKNNNGEFLFFFCFHRFATPPPLALRSIGWVECGWDMFWRKLGNVGLGQWRTTERKRISMTK